MKTNGSQKRLVIAGTGGGSGKTTVTIGLMAALKRRGLAVQGFKCGPDYIDPTYHTAVTGRASRNLDSWMLPRETVKEIFLRASAGADISVIEGVMGFYDGRDPKSNTGSTADISLLLDCPVLLVVDGRGMARSAAAIVKGFQALEQRVRIAAVFANNVGSEGHYRIIREAVEQECGVPVIGYLTRDQRLAMPERHLGLVPSVERGSWTGCSGRLRRGWPRRRTWSGRCSLRNAGRFLGWRLRPCSFRLHSPFVSALPWRGMRRFIFTTRKIWSCSS
ncbi:cobyrinate a,c-diamide synthase [Paenibacillus sp. P25]|nr:cobyrinate a,c-diamide synthase [Paenibacillus sp. P25]